MRQLRRANWSADRPRGESGYWTDGALLNRMRRGWPAPPHASAERRATICGGGSTREAAANVAAWLPMACWRYDIRELVNAGAGDLHWWPQATMNCMRIDAIHVDLVPRHPLVERADITKDNLPPCDAIVCRHVLIHFDPRRIKLTLARFRAVAKFLFASQYDDAPPFNKAGSYNPTDLRPLLGEPIEWTEDAGSTLALWRLTP